jgi:tetratricopeptide (TPR) repeat protein
MSDRPNKIRLFISHSSKDKEAFVEPLAEWLDKLNYEVWLDIHSIPLSKSIFREILKGVKKSDIGIIVLSEAFVSLDSKWTTFELGMLANSEKPLYFILYKISPVEVAKVFPFLADLNGVPVKDDKDLEKVIERLRKEFIKIEEKINVKKSNKYNVVSFDTSKDNYNILILPFRNPEDRTEKPLIGKELEIKFKENKNLNKLGLDVAYLQYDTFDFTTKMAKKIGKEIKGTNMVIWGKDSKTKDLHHQICFNYAIPIEYSSGYHIPTEGKADKFEIERIDSLTEGDIQFEIEDIVFWFLGKKNFKNQDYANALTAFHKIEKEKYKNEDLYFIIATSFYFLKLYKDAEKYFLKVIEINPNHFRTHYYYANLLSSKFKYFNKAEEHFLKAIEIDPNYADVHFWYAVILKDNLNNYNKAEEHFLKAIEIDPNNADVHFWYAVMLYANLNNYSEAEKHYLKAIEADSNHFEAHYNYAILLIDKRNDVKVAEEHYLKAIEINPNHAEVQYCYALLLADHLNNYNKAEEHFLKAIEINPNCAVAYFYYALLLGDNLNDAGRAEEQYLKALEFDPENYVVYFNYALLLADKFNKIKEAQEIFEKALKIKTDSADLHFSYTYFLVMHELDDFNKARNHYIKAITLNQKYKNKKDDDYFGII